MEVNKKDLRKHLTFFNETAKKTFKILNLETMKVHIHTTPIKHTIDFTFPEIKNETIDSITINLRKFIASKDYININKFKEYYESPIVLKEERKLLKNEISKRDNLFNKTADFKLEHRKEYYTNKELFDIFLYGNIIHDNRKEEYEKFKNNEIFLMIKYKFLELVKNFVTIIKNIFKLNFKVLNRLNI